MQPQTAPVTLESVYAELQEVKALLKTPKAPLVGATVGDLLTPKEACEALKISRSQFERMKRNGFIKVHRINPNGHKIYVSLAEISQSFRKDFKNTTA